MNVLHLSLSFVRPSALSMVWPLVSTLDFMSSLILSIHLILGLPLFLLPITFIWRALFGSLSMSILETCPNHLNLLSWILSTTVDFRPIIFITSSFLSLCSRDTPRIPRSQPISFTSTLSSSTFFRVQHSLPYRSTGRIIVSYTLLLVYHVISLALQTLVIFPKAIEARPILLISVS